MTRIEHETIDTFLRDAQDRIEAQPGAMPFMPVYGHLVINWLRGRLKQLKQYEVEQ